MSMDLAGLNRAGRLFCAANVSSKNVIAVTTSMTGVILYNPAGSGRIALIADAGFVWVTAPVAVHQVGIALAAPNVTVPTTLTAIGSGVLRADGTGTSGDARVKAYDAAALPVAPVIVRWLISCVYGSGTGESPHLATDHIDGAIALVPGAVMAFAAVTTTAAGMGAVTWGEYDL